MFFTITYTKKPATDLGYLLHKNPSRPQSFELNFGKAHVFYPEISEERTTIALMLEVDPIGLVRGKKGELGLFDYVNDRPYVSSSFISVAMTKVFGTALSGKSKERPDLAEVCLPFEVRIAMVPCDKNDKLIRRLFEPLGYQVTIETYQLDDTYTDWGLSNYFTITLTGHVKIQDLLNHLYVLIPVLDRDKHYYIDEEEIDKLIRHGGEWLKIHPEIELITNRYLYKRKNLIQKALKQLIDEEELQEDIIKEKILNLNEQRIESVFSILKEKQPKRILDLGCGEGNLLSYVAKHGKFEQLTGVDVSFGELEKAKVKLDRLPEYLKKKINLFQGSILYKDKRFNGYDVATIIEVIEHLDANRLKSFEQVVFKYATPKIVIITTPNIEYNKNYTNLGNEYRHDDHRFEWTRKEFETWANELGLKYRYKVEIIGIGPMSSEFGYPTQMGVFERCN